MKTKLSLLMLVISLFLAHNAIGYEVPSDATIKVFDSKGNQIGSMSRKQYKEVNIEDHPAASLTQVTASHATGKKEAAEPEEENDGNGLYYTAILSAGVGKDGLDYSHTNGNHVVDEKTSPVGMAQLCASGKKSGLGICAHATTNQFYGLGVKLDFGR
jgi:hypothetical protein